METGKARDQGEETVWTETERVRGKERGEAKGKRTGMEKQMMQLVMKVKGIELQEQVLEGGGLARAGWSCRNLGWCCKSLRKGLLDTSS